MKQARKEKYERIRKSGTFLKPIISIESNKDMKRNFEHGSKQSDTFLTSEDKKSYSTPTWNNSN